VLALIAALAASSLSVEGNWINQDRTALVRIAPCGSRLCGTVIRVLARGSGIPTTDINNHDPALRSHPLVGLRVLSGFAGAGSRWEGGRAYDPKSGNSYRARLRLEPDGKLEVTGCVLFICRSQDWNRPGN
jgi:uncharacterized protein (DUF2147 family)